jgi:hypothetical protein
MLAQSDAVQHPENLALRESAQESPALGYPIRDNIAN